MNFLHLQVALVFSLLVPQAFSLLGLPIGLPLLECDITCLLCTGPNPDQCITCLSGLLPLLGTCQCPDGKYFAYGLLSCLNCDPSCLTCDGGTSSDCTSCQTGYNLYNGVCYPPCASTQYFDTTTISCQACNTYCQTCSGPASNQCSSCLSASIVNGACQCPSGQYLTSLGGCATCDPSCKECSGSANNQCTACASGMVLQNGQCNCLTGNYMVTSPLGCQACDPMCLGCSGSGSTSCTSCKNNLVLSSGECKCPASTFYNSATSSCSACSSLCSSCSGANSNECTGCKSNLVLSSGSCACPLGTFLDTTINTCKPCDSTCTECSGPSSSECTACDTASGLSLSSGQCLCIGGGCSCSAGTYYDATLLTCKSCNPTCETCSGPSSSECDSCRSDYILLASDYCQCTTPPCSCPSGTYYATGSGECESCDGSCAECTGPSTSECTSCVNNLDYVSGSCTCLDYFYEDSSLFCFDCDSTCQTCSGPLNTDCTACRPGLSPVGGVCKCPTGTYFDSIGGGCSPCAGSCETCSGPDQSQCLTCSSSKTLNSGYCIDVCSSSQYRETDMSCQSCDSSCETCSGPSSSECASCTSPKTLQSGTCPDIDNGCNYQCATCNTAANDQCLTCKGNLFLVEVNNEANVGSCGASCPSGYYYVVVGSQKTCRQKIGLDNRLGHGAELSEIVLDFGRDITPYVNQLLNSIEIAIQFRSDQTPVSYTYTLNFSASDPSSLLLNLTFYGHLLPRNVLYITYNLPSQASSDQSSLIYVYRQIQTIRLNEFYGYSKGMQDYVDTAAIISSVTLQANQIYSWTSSLFLRSIHAIRSKVVEDMIGFFIFLNVDFTPNFVQFCNDGMNSFELIVPNIYVDILQDMDYKDDTRILRSRILSMKARRYQARLLSNGTEEDSNDDGSPIDQNLSTKMFLLNHGASVTLLTFVLAAVIVVETLRFIVGKIKRLHRVEKLLEKASQSLTYNFFLEHFLGEYQSFIFFSMLQVVTSLRISEKGDSLNVTLAIFFFICSIVCLPAVFYLLHVIFKRLKAKELVKKKSGEEHEDDFLERVEALHQSYKHTRYVDLLYTHLLVLRCFGFALMLLFVVRFPLVQIIYLLVTTVGIIFYLLYYKPLKNNQQQVLTLIYEFLFLSVTIMTLVLHIFNSIFLDDIETRSSICLIILTLATSMFALNLTSFVFEVIEFKNKFFNKTSKIAPVASAAANAILQKRPIPILPSNGSQITNISLQKEDIMPEEAQTDEKVNRKLGLSRSYKIVKHSVDPPEETLDSSPEAHLMKQGRKYTNILLSVQEAESPTKKVDESSIMLRLSEEYSKGINAHPSRLLSRERSQLDKTWSGVDTYDTIQANENLLLSHLKLNRTMDRDTLSRDMESERDGENSLEKSGLRGRFKKVLGNRKLKIEEDEKIPVIRLDEKDTLLSPNNIQTPTKMFPTLTVAKVEDKIMERKQDKDKLDVTSSKRLETGENIDTSKIGSLVYDENVQVRRQRKSHKTQVNNGLASKIELSKLKE